MAYPSECCGWLSGPAGGDSVTALRPCANGAASGAAYTLDGADLLAFAMSFDGPAPARVLYHSHPGGHAVLSEADRRLATNAWGDGPAYPVAHLVVALHADAVTDAALFLWSEAAGGFVSIARWTGAPD